MAVIKRDKGTSSEDLIVAIRRFVVLLREQGEDDACSDLEAAADVFGKSQVGTPGHKDAVRTVIEAFEGEHELIAYTLSHNSDPTKWTVADELCDASTRVLSLARRLK